MTRNVRIGVSIAISAVFLYFAARGVNWSEAGKALASANYVYFIPMLLVTLLTLYIRALRWRVLLRPLGHPSMRNLIDATNIGFMANMVLPLRMGEVIRPIMLSRKENTPLGGILATIVLERVMDLLTLVFLFAIGISLSSAAVTEETRQIQQWGYRLCFVAFALAGAVIFVRWQEALALRLLRLVLSPLPQKLAHPIEHFFTGFVQALEILDSPKTFLAVAGWSALLWIAITSIQSFTLLAFNLPVPLVLGSIIVSTFTAIVISAPSAPGYIGAFQFGCAVALAVFNIDKTQAFAYSIVVHLSQFIAVIGAGLFSLMRGGGGMSLKQLEEVAESDATLA